MATDKGLTADDRALLSEWIQEDYLNDETLEPIKEQFFEESSVELGNFLLPHRAEELKFALNNAKFEHIGPYNHRCCDVLRQGDGDGDGDVLVAFQKLMLSESFARFLELMSGGLLVLDRQVNSMCDGDGDGHCTLMIMCTIISVVECTSNETRFLYTFS